MPADEGHRGTYIPTGWRIVGQRAEAIAERAATYGWPPLEPGADADTLFAVKFTLPPSLDGRPTAERLLEHLTGTLRESWPDCPRLARDHEVRRPASRFAGVRFDCRATPGTEWVGEVIWRAVHPMVAGAPITTRVYLEERPAYLRVSIQVTADEGRASVRGQLGAGQVQPALLAAMRRDGLRPIWQGAPLEAVPLRSVDIRELVQVTLPSPDRRLPLVVLAPLEEGGYVVEPDDLAWELFGRARLCVLHDHRLSFELTDTIGERRMSCYKGAARAYLPSWSLHDDPFTHPLLVADRLGDPLMRAAWLGELGIWTGSQEKLPPTLAQQVEAAAAPVEGVSPIAARPAKRAPPPTPVPQALLETILAEVQRLSGLGAAVARLADEVERLRTISAVRSSSTNAIERRLARLEDILDQAFPAGAAAATDAEPSGPRPAPALEPDDGPDDRAPLVAIVQEAAEAHSADLLFLDSAFASAAESPYEDPERVRALLDAMARVARKRREGLLGTSLREAFVGDGIDYRSSIARHTPARLREQYRFVRGSTLIEAEEHIVLGKTYDPRRCLRIYFSSRVVGEARFVIAHVGRHFQVLSST